MKKSLTALAVLATAAATAAPAAAAGSPVIDNCAGRAQFEPTSITLFCGDANSFLEKISWKGWGNPTVAATAVQVTDNCVPNCAAGKPVDKHVSVTVSGLKSGRYTKMTIDGKAWDLTRRGPVVG